MEVSIYWKRIPFPIQQKMKQEGESAGRRMLRSILTERYGVSDDRIVFENTPEGKPVLPCLPEAAFSISDSGEIVAAAVSVGCRESGCPVRSLGFDLERRRQISAELIRRFFHPEEQAWICEEKSKEAQNRRALMIWTRKEAYGKWSGRGIRFQMQKQNIRQKAIWDRTMSGEEEIGQAENGQPEKVIWSLYADTLVQVTWISWSGKINRESDKEEADGLI